VQLPTVILSAPMTRCRALSFVRLRKAGIVRDGGWAGARPHAGDIFIIIIIDDVLIFFMRWVREVSLRKEQQCRIASSLIHLIERNPALISAEPDRPDDACRSS
jgi:hypothetical protein